MLGAFACARYRFTVEAVTPLRLSAFSGATLRGGFGHVFKRTVCIWPPGDCRRCLLKNTCAYPYIFETAPPPGSEKLRGLDQVPRPFVIEAPSGPCPEGPRTYGPGERFEFRLVLVGRGIDLLPYFVFTFCELGRVGLGLGRGRCQVAEVQAEDLDGSRCLYTAGQGVLSGTGERVTREVLAARGVGPMGRRLAVEFLTPTRIRSDGAICAEVTFQELVRAILRRLSSLCYFHCGAALEVDFKELIEAAGRVRTAGSRLRWREQGRFSGRQRQRIEMGGVVGRVVYEAKDGAWAAFLPLLRAGEWVHVGKGAVMGQGKYELRTA